MRIMLSMLLFFVTVLSTNAEVQTIKNVIELAHYCGASGPQKFVKLDSPLVNPQENIKNCIDAMVTGCSVYCHYTDCQQSNEIKDTCLNYCPGAAAQCLHQDNAANFQAEERLKKEKEAKALEQKAVNIQNEIRQEQLTTSAKVERIEAEKNKLDAKEASLKSKEAKAALAAEQAINKIHAEEAQKGLEPYIKDADKEITGGEDQKSWFQKMIAPLTQLGLGRNSDIKVDDHSAEVPTKKPDDTDNASGSDTYGDNSPTSNDDAGDDDSGDAAADNSSTSNDDAGDDDSNKNSANTDEDSATDNSSTSNDDAAGDDDSNKNSADTDEDSATDNSSTSNDDAGDDDSGDDAA